MSPDTNRPVPGPGPTTYAPGIIKKLWLWPTVALVLAVIGDVFNLSWGWNIVVLLAAFPSVAVNARMLALKRKRLQAPLIGVTRVFFVLSVFASAVLCVSFFDRNYGNAILMFIALVACSSISLWGCDVSERYAARKAAGEV